MRATHQLRIAILIVAALSVWRAAAAVDTISGASARALPDPDEPGTSTLLVADNARIHLFIEGYDFALSRTELETWVRRSAQTVAAYYGRFPVDEAWVAIRGARGDAVMFGTAIPTGVGATVNVTLGLAAQRESLAQDWILVHEMVHLAFPTLARRHHWLEEGLSVYVESIARAGTGDLTADQVWRGFLDGMPNGLPRDGDRGLDHTPTWGRTYWGGALFCLLADVRIREQTGGEKSLRDALRAILAAGYDMTVEAELSDVLAVADRATGVTVLTDLWREMRDRPVPAELGSLWADLGVTVSAGVVSYDDDAPLAGIRRSLIRPL